MHPMMTIAVRAARNAGNIIARNVERLDALTIEEKAENDYVSEIDRMAEREIINTIHKSYPDHSIFAEESGEQENNPDYQWIIDPLDGTTNFLHGFPQFAVSIALRQRGRLEVGVIYDPMREELFTASRGDGAQLDGKRIRVSNRKGLEGALLGTGFPYSDMTHLEPYLATLKSVIPQTAGIRRPGSAALDLAYVAAGRIDGFWEFDLNAWDIAAGALIIQEAGGLVGDLTGGHKFLESGHVVAGNPKMFKAILQAIQPHLTEDLKR